MHANPRRPAPRPGNDQAMSTEEHIRELFANARRPAPAVRRDPVDPRHPEAMSAEDYFRELFANAGCPAPGEPASPAPARPCNPANPEEVSTEEYFRQLFAQAQAPQAPAPAQSAQSALDPEQFTEMSTEDYFRELFAQAQGQARQPLGPRPGLEPPALSANFKRIRGGNPLVSYELLVDEDGRIIAKHENVAGVETYFIYEYDPAGHLLRAWRGGKLAEEYAYDPQGARSAAWSAGQGEWNYAYDPRGRLTAAGPWKFSYAEDGSLREAWTPDMEFMLWYNQEGGLSRISLPGHRILRCESIAPGLPVEKCLDARPVESFTWRSPLQLATYQDHQRGLKMAFHYQGSGRLPQAVTIQTAQGQAVYCLGFDQAGSLKAVASQDPDGGLRVVKIIDYDSFGNILSDSNPNLFLPLSFAGGLRDRFTGLVRFCHRDYDPTVGRFTAPDPLGDTGGDHDLYDYCVDEPVGRIDPEGLKEGAVAEEGGFFDGLKNMFGKLGDKIGGLFSPDEAQAAAGTTQQAEANSSAPSQAAGADSQPAGATDHARKPDFSTHSTMADAERAYLEEAKAQASKSGGMLDNTAPGWGGVGIAVDAGAGVGVGPKLSDPKAIADGFGNGVFAEYTPGGENSTGKFDAGLFKYETEGKIVGGKLGAGYNVTVYDPPASKVLEGDTAYETWHVGPFSATRLHDPETGRIVGWGFNAGGKGAGFGREVGESKGEIAKRTK